MPTRGPYIDQWLKTLDTEDSKRIASKIACLGIAFHALSYYEEDCSHNAEVKIDLEDDSITILDFQKCCNDSIEAFRRSFGKIIGAPYHDCQIRCSTDVTLTGEKYSSITQHITRLFLSAYRSVLTQLAITGYEYFLLIGWNGEIAYGRGDETRIHLPLIPGVVMAHTHPSPFCYPSGHDLRSSADFFSSGGLVEVIVSSNCAAVTRLTRPLSEDDYWKLIELSEKAKKPKDYENYLSILNEVPKLSSIAFEVF